MLVRIYKLVVIYNHKCDILIMLCGAVKSPTPHIPFRRQLRFRISISLLALRHC